jgi:hypothetical protein
MSDNLGTLADAIYAKTSEIAAVEAQKKELENQKRELEDRLLALMQDAGTDIVRGSSATASLSETTRYGIADLEEFTKFVLKRKALQLFERRIAQNAARELQEALGNKPIPGLSTFSQTRLNLRKRA